MMRWILNLFAWPTRFDPFAEAEPWFLRNSLDLDSIRFSCYDDARLVAHDEAAVLVGVGDREDGWREPEDDDEGGHVGFAIEVVPGRGVVRGALLRPSGIASWHRDAAAAAKLTGETLVDVLQQHAAAHRAITAA